MVPFLRGNTYQRENCILKGVSGVPTECQNHTYFQNMNLNRGVSILKYKFYKVFNKALAASDLPQLVEFRRAAKDSATQLE